MVAVSKTPAQIYVTGQSVRKPDVITLENEILGAIDADRVRLTVLETTAGDPGLQFDTYADMQADLDHDEGTVAYVNFDPDATLNGKYVKPSLSGDWEPANDRADVALAAARVILPNEAQGGNLNGGVGTWFSIYKNAIKTTDTFFTSRGCNWVIELANGEDAYFAVPIQSGRKVVKGDWVSSAVLVKSNTASTFPTGNQLRTGVVPPTGPQDGLTFADYVAADTTHRAYDSVWQITATDTDVPMTFAYIQVSNTLGVGKVIQISGFCAAFSKFQPGGVDTTDFTRPAAPDILFPAAINVVAGRPLELNVTGLTGDRDLTPFDFALKGTNGNRPNIIPSSRMLVVDSSRVVGDATLLAYLKGTTGKLMVGNAVGPGVYSKAVTVYSAAAPAAGSPKILGLGNSLTYQKWFDQMALKLAEAGKTPVYLGTFPTAGNNAAEGRSSYKVTDYTRKSIYINPPNDASPNGDYICVPLRVGGGVSPVLTPVLSGGTAGHINSVTITNPGSGLTNGTNIPIYVENSTGGVVNNSFIGHCTIAGGVVTATFVDADDSAFTSAPTVHLAPSVAEYLALSAVPGDFAARHRFNPFLRPAVGGDPAGNVFNHYIFDFDDYLTKMGIADPDFVFIELSANDVRQKTAADALADCSEGLAIIYASIRAALPTAHVAFVMPGLVAEAAWTSMKEIIRWVLATYDGKHLTDKTWIVPTWALTHWLLGYPIAALGTTPTQVVNKNNDDTHFDVIGASQFAEGPFALVMKWS